MILAAKKKEMAITMTLVEMLNFELSQGTFQVLISASHDFSYFTMITTNLASMIQEGLVPLHLRKLLGSAGDTIKSSFVHPTVKM